MRRIIIILFFILGNSNFLVFSQQEGSMDNPIYVGTFIKSFSYSNSQDSHLFLNQYGRSTKEVVYSFRLYSSMDIEINNCNSENGDTHLFLLDQSRNVIAYNNDSSPDDYHPCQRLFGRIVLRDLPSGDYFVVTEGYYEDGLITTNIKGVVRGDNTDLPILAGTFNKPFDYLDTQNTGYYTNQYSSGSGRPTCDVYHRFSTTMIMDLTISHCDSKMPTCVHLLNSSKVCIASNCGYQVGNMCADTSRAYLNIKGLAAGTYYVVSEGRSDDGDIKLHIKGEYSAGNSMNYPIFLGTYASPFMYSNTQNMLNFSNEYNGHSTNDVFYKFTTTRPMEFSASHCGSSSNYDTYIYLLDQSGNIIAENNDCSGDSCCSYQPHAFLVQRELPAGTYYVVSEGYSENKTIKTTIQLRPRYWELENSKGENYIQTLTPRVGVSDLKEMEPEQCMQTIQYFDGLGRPIETVQKLFTPQKNDLVSAQFYDALGRDSIKTLPVSYKANGAFAPLSSLMNTTVNYYANDQKPYAKTVYEKSPLNRVLEQYGPGQSWHDNSKSVKTAYLANTSTGNQVCALYKVTGSHDNPTLTKSGNYNINQLYVTETKDEDGNTSYEFKDKLGQLVLTRQMNNSIKHDTYYVYDDFGNKTFVLPPVLSDSLTANSTWGESADILKRHAYLYRYDHRNRCIAKRLPGADWQYLVYDKTDHLILSQDGEQRLRKEWTLNKYDIFGRLILLGIYTDDIARSHAVWCTQIKDSVVIETPVTGANTTNGYSWKSLGVLIPFDKFKVMQINYYDDYNHLLGQDPKFSTNLSYATKTGYGVRYTNSSCSSCSAKGLLVGTRIWLLDDSSMEIVTAMYYDDKKRVIQKKSTNQLGGYDKEYYAYNFTGQITEKFSEHTATGQSKVTEIYKYEYDHAGRLLKTKYKLDNLAEIEQSSLTYDEIGRVKSKKINNSSSALINYSYNLRGWLKSMSSSYFSEFLTYETTSWIGGTPCYNGNISSIMTALDGGDSWLEYNRYYYDGLNRLTSGGYTDWPTYLRNVYLYDKNGNIKSQQIIDGDGMGITNTYKYNGNQLLSFESTGGSYTFYNTHLNNAWPFPNGSHVTVEYLYDKNGNMTSDYNKGISKIQYNYLNLPSVVQMHREGHMAEYVYDALGVKRKEINKVAKGVVIVPMGTILPLTSSQIRYTEETYYLGNKEYYKDAAGTLQLKKIHTPEGYVAVNGTQRIHHTYIRDHLGSVRTDLPFTGNRFNYCYLPFGMDYVICQDGPYTINPLTTARFNGKERMPMFEMNLLDYGARLYDPPLGRWHGMDLLAEKYYSVSPYAYCLNNPVKYVDPDGKRIVFTSTNPKLGDHSIGNERYVYIPNKGVVDEKGRNVALNSQARIIVDVYNRAYNSNSPKIKNHMRTIVNSDLDHFVSFIPASSSSVISYQEGSDSRTKDRQTATEGKRIGSITSFNFSKKATDELQKSEGIPSSFFTTIIHELKHQYDFDQGKMRDIEYPSTNKSPHEQRAVWLENLARTLENLPQRTTYGGEKITPKE